MPIVRGSMTSLFSYEIALFIRHVSIGNFFVSLLALIFFLLELALFGFAQFAIGTSPNPNIESYFSVFAPDALKSFVLELFMMLRMFSSQRSIKICMYKPNELTLV